MPRYVLVDIVAVAAVPGAVRVRNLLKGSFKTNAVLRHHHRSLEELQKITSTIQQLVSSVVDLTFYPAFSEGP